MRVRIVSKLAIAAALLIVGGVGATGASAATPACGRSCIALSSTAFGSFTSPTFVLADQPQAQNVGQPLTLARASSNQGEDFTISDQGLVSDFFEARLMSAGMNALYGPLEAVEIGYSPFGVQTGLCVGVGSTPANGTRVALEPCGVTVKTVWVVDGALSSFTTSASAVPLINGATNNSFFDPYVLSALAPGLPLTTTMLHIAGTSLATNQQ
jgi:hypothetical protein